MLYMVIICWISLFSVCSFYPLCVRSEVASNYSVFLILYCLILCFMSHNHSAVLRERAHSFMQSETKHQRVSAASRASLWLTTCDKSQVKCIDIDKITMLQITKRNWIAAPNYGSETPDLPKFAPKAMDYGLGLKLWIRGLFIVMTNLVLLKSYGLQESMD